MSKKYEYFIERLPQGYVIEDTKEVLESTQILRYKCPEGHSEKISAASAVNKLC